MDQGVDVASRSAASPWLRHLLVDLAWLLGLGFLGVILAEFLPDVVEYVVAWLGWVAGFALAGLRAEPGWLARRILRLWAVVTLTMLGGGFFWAIWVYCSFPHPLDAWPDSLTCAFYSMWLALWTIVPALAGWGVALLVRYFRFLVCID